MAKTGTAVAQMPATESSSHHGTSNRSCIHITAVPLGLLVRAICVVRDETCSPERTRRVNRHPNDYIAAEQSRACALIMTLYRETARPQTESRSCYEF